MLSDKQCNAYSKMRNYPAKARGRKEKKREGKKQGVFDFLLNAWTF